MSHMGWEMFSFIDNSPHIYFSICEVGAWLALLDLVIAHVYRTKLTLYMFAFLP